MRNRKKMYLTNPEISGYKKIIEDGKWRGERVQNICKALLMYKDGKDINQIIEETGISRRSLFYYKKKIIKDSFFMLRKRKSTNASILENYTNQISEDFKQTHIKTYKQAQKRIEEITGIKRSETQIRNYLIKAGFKKNKNGNYNQPTLSVKNVEPKIKDTCLYKKRDEVEKFIDELCPQSESFMIKKLKEKYPELSKFPDECISTETRSISPF